MLETIQKYTDTLLEVIVLYIVCLLVAAVTFSFVEGETFIKSLYWAGITTTTTGYGDITPKTVPGMVLAFVVTHLSAFVIAPLVIVKLNQKMLRDENVFTDAEQREVLDLLRSIDRRCPK
jgi:voltage-gated potassium channel